MVKMLQQQLHTPPIATGRLCVLPSTVRMRARPVAVATPVTGMKALAFRRTIVRPGPVFGYPVGMIGRGDMISATGANKYKKSNY